MLVRICYDPDLSKIGTTVEVDRVTGRQMIRNGRAVEATEPVEATDPAEPEPVKKPAARRARKRADG